MDYALHTYAYCRILSHTFLSTFHVPFSPVYRARSPCFLVTVLVLLFSFTCHLVTSSPFTPIGCLFFRHRNRLLRSSAFSKDHKNYSIDSVSFYGRRQSVASFVTHLLSFLRHLRRRHPSSSHPEGSSFQQWCIVLHLRAYRSWGEPSPSIRHHPVQLDSEDTPNISFHVSGSKLRKQSMSRTRLV